MKMVSDKDLKHKCINCKSEYRKSYNSDIICKKCKEIKEVEKGNLMVSIASIIISIFSLGIIIFILTQVSRYVYETFKLLEFPFYIFVILAIISLINTIGNIFVYKTGRANVEGLIIFNLLSIFIFPGGGWLVFIGNEERYYKNE